MEISLIAIILLVLIFLYLSYRSSLKSRMMQDNFLIQSEATTKAINEMQKEEDAVHEGRLLKNPRYKALRTAMNREIGHYRTFQLAEIKLQFKAAKTVQKEISIDGFHIQLTSKDFLDSNTSPALHITATPKSFLGFFFSIEEWIYF